MYTCSIMCILYTLLKPTLGPNLTGTLKSKCTVCFRTLMALVKDACCGLLTFLVCFSLFCISKLVVNCYGHSYHKWSVVTTHDTSHMTVMFHIIACSGIENMLLRGVSGWEPCTMTVFLVTCGCSIYWSTAIKLLSSVITHGRAPVAIYNSW